MILRRACSSSPQLHTVFLQSNSTATVYFIMLWLILTLENGHQSRAGFIKLNLIFHRNKEMLVEGSYVGMMQVDHGDTPAEAKLHTESFKLLLCYKVLGLVLGLGYIHGFPILFLAFFFQSLHKLLSCRASVNAKLCNQQSVLYSSHSRQNDLITSCSCATRTGAIPVQGSFRSALPLVQLLLE